MGFTMGVKFENSRKQTRRSGTSMVEMVIILPLLMMILFAMLEFGVLFGRWHTISNAAREGARTAVIFRRDCNAAAVETEVRTRVKAYAAPLGITLTDGDIAVTGVCGSSTTSSTVNVQIPHIFNVIPNLATSVSPSINLLGRSVMRNEGTG
jgi:Flp pilus assembly protein TadG